MTSAMLTLLDDGHYFVQFVRGLHPMPEFIQALCPKTLKILKNMMLLDGETEEQAIDRLDSAMGKCQRLGVGILYRVEPLLLTDEYMSYTGYRDRYYEGWDKSKPL